MTELKQYAIDPFNARIAWKVLTALNHTDGFNIIRFLCEHNNEDIKVHDIYSFIGIEQATCSYHLKLLRNANFIKFNRSGKFMHYSINEDSFERMANAIKSLSLLYK